MTVHAFLMWVGWTIFGLVMFATNRWFTHLSDKTQLLHALSGLVMLAMATTAFVLLVVKLGFKIGSPHKTYGFIQFIVMFIVALGGIIALRIKLTTQWNQWRVKCFRTIHRAAGVLVLLSSIAVVSLGFNAYFYNVPGHDHLKFLKPLNIGITLFIFFAFEVRYQFFRLREDRFEVKEQHPVITHAEFAQRVKSGEKLCILDNLVLDLSGFAHKHPGGAFLINYTAGRDISKFFYGGYALEGNSNDPNDPTQRHTHSNVARQIANRHIVGVIDKKEVQQNLFYIDMEESNKLSPSAATFVFKGVQKQGLVSDIQGLQNYYRDMTMLGKHYTVVSLGFRGQEPFKHGQRMVRRHYTISNCMRKVFYDELLRCLDSRLEIGSSSAQGEVFDQKLMESTAEGIVNMSKDMTMDEQYPQVNITVKNYDIKYGLSQRFFSTDTQSQIYQIKGPMGKGLGLSPQTQGTHIAFAAGTGILAFMDLVARMALGMIDAIAYEDRVHPEFRLVLFASFISKENSFGLELLEKLRTYSKALRSDQFELHLRFSVEKSVRWDNSFIEGQLANNKGCKKIWVCGPPLMEENFDKYLYRLAPKFGLDFKT